MKKRKHYCPTCGSQYPRPDNASIWYMHDNHTFKQLRGATLDEILVQAQEIALKSPYGMLCPVTLLRGDKEIERVGPPVHADDKGLGDTTEWEKAIRENPDAMRLIEPNKPWFWLWPLYWAVTGKIK
jgi:hypothetical protein